MKTKTLTHKGQKARAQAPALKAKPAKRDRTRDEKKTVFKGGRSSARALGIKSIMVPIDFSPGNQEALSFARAFADQFGAKLTLVHVSEPMGTPDFAASFPLVMEADRILAKLLADLNALVKERKIPARLIERTLVRQGRSFHEIAEAARVLKVDLIIIATHGYTGLKHALLGSTAERVVQHAPCPVLVVRERSEG